MEVIKRKILLEDSITRSSESPNSWGTITATTFYLNIFITQTIDDMGLFTDIEHIVADAVSTPPDYQILIDKLNNLGYSFNFMNGVPTPIFSTINTPHDLWEILRFPYKPINSYYNYIKKAITGLTETRIEDVTSYDYLQPLKVGFDMNSESYYNYENKLINGVDRVISNSNPKIYVFDAENDVNIGTSKQNSGLYFEDYDDITRIIKIDGEDTTVNQTIVKYIGEGLNETNTSLSALTKEEYLFGKIYRPEVDNDVFIDRSKNSVLDKHLRLSEIRTIKGLEKYGNGFYKIDKQ